MYDSITVLLCCAISYYIISLQSIGSVSSAGNDSGVELIRRTPAYVIPRCKTLLMIIIIMIMILPLQQPVTALISAMIPH